jgi:hypothetical protein
VTDFSEGQKYEMLLREGEIIKRKDKRIKEKRPKTI